MGGDLLEAGLVARTGGVAAQGKVEEGGTAALIRASGRTTGSATGGALGSNFRSAGGLGRESFPGGRMTVARGPSAGGGGWAAQRAEVGQLRRAGKTVATGEMRGAATAPHLSNAGWRNIVPLPQPAATPAKTAAPGRSNDGIAEMEHARVASETASPAQRPETAEQPVGTPAWTPGVAVAPLNSGNAAPLETGLSHAAAAESDAAGAVNTQAGSSAQAASGARSQGSGWSVASGKGLVSAKSVPDLALRGQNRSSSPGLESSRREDASNGTERDLKVSRTGEVRPVTRSQAREGTSDLPTGASARSERAEAQPRTDAPAPTQEKETEPEGGAGLSEGMRQAAGTEPLRATATTQAGGGLQAEAGRLTATERPAITAPLPALEQAAAAPHASELQSRLSPRVSMNAGKAGAAGKESGAGLGLHAGHAEASGSLIAHGSGLVRNQPGTEGQDGANPGLARDLAGMRANAPGSNGAAEPPRGASGAPGAHDSFAALDAEAGAGGPSWIHAGAHRAEAGFQDPALGWVGVRADASGGSIHASLVPASADAAVALGGQMAGLSAHLAERHTQVETLTVARPEGQGREAGMTQSGNEGTHQGSGQGSGQGYGDGSGPGRQVVERAEAVLERAVQTGDSRLNSMARDVSYAGAPLGGTHISVMA